MKVLIWGLGEIGRAWVKHLSDKPGIELSGYDKSPIVAEQVARNYSVELNPTPPFYLLSPKKAENKDVIVVCVPTGLDTQNRPDISAVSHTSTSLWEFPGLIILESTVPIGTTRRLFSGHKASIVYSPERTDPGHDHGVIPRLFCGLTPEATEKGRELFNYIGIPAIETSSVEVAEAAKLAENAHRAANITWVQKFALTMKQQGLDVHEVLDAAATKPFGFVRYEPGIGIGGHCIPITPGFLPTRGYKNEIDEGNWRRVNQITDLVMVHAKHGDPILLLGESYKPGVESKSNSAAHTLATMLSGSGLQPTFNHLDYKGKLILLAVPDGKEKAWTPQEHPDKIFIDPWGRWRGDNVYRI